MICTVLADLHIYGSASKVCVITNINPCWKNCLDLNIYCRNIDLSQKNHYRIEIRVSRLKYRSLALLSEIKICASRNTSMWQQKHTTVGLW